MAIKANMENTRTPSQQYAVLLHDLKLLQDQIRADLLQAANPVILEGYWRIGQRLMQEAGLQSAGRMILISRLAADLAMEKTLLSRIMKFYRLWSEELPSRLYPALTWSHFKLLISVRDDAARRFYSEEANRNRWYVRQLKQNIAANAYYRSLEAAAVDERGKTGQATAAASTLMRKTERMHLYSAVLQKVVDGDTLLLFVDLGFDTWRSQRVRLRGIDAPEKKTPAGDLAKQFVEEKLRANRHLIVQTFKVDMYGRYVGDIFYLLGEGDKERIAREGNFLNQEILDAGHAKMID
jgi:endonuclease YncB( thermonuclease family)